MKRQIVLLTALVQAEQELRAAGNSLDAIPSDQLYKQAGLLVVAARVEEFCDTWAENIHRAGEGI